MESDLGRRLRSPQLLGTCSAALADFLLLLSAAGTWGGLGSPGPNFSLADIDECAQGAGILCTFRCLNVPGSYQCACPDQGYTMMANGRTCKGEQWPCPAGLRGLQATQGGLAHQQRKACATRVVLTEA